MFADAKTLATSIVDWAINQPDDDLSLALEDLGADGSPDETIERLEDYFSFDASVSLFSPEEHLLVIKYDSEDSYGSSDVFRALVLHLADFMAGNYISVTETIYDSRRGFSSLCYFIDRFKKEHSLPEVLELHPPAPQGKPIDPRNFLVICEASGTILSLGSCRLVPSIALDPDEDYSDREAIELAQTYGVPLAKALHSDLPNPSFGENAAAGGEP